MAEVLDSTTTKEVSAKVGFLLAPFFPLHLKCGVHSLTCKVFVVAYLTTLVFFKKGNSFFFAVQ